MKMFALALAAALVVPGFAFATDNHGAAATGHDAAAPAGHDAKAEKHESTTTTTTKETTHQDKMKSKKK